MLKTESFGTDILVIGSGIAGMIAAIEARKGGAEVAIATKAMLGKESATGVARTFRAAEEEPWIYKNVRNYDTKPGKHLENWPLVRVVKEESQRQIQNLISLGVPMEYKAGGEAYDTVPIWRPKGSESVHGGAIALDLLAPVAKNMSVRAVENCTVVSLLKDGGRVIGASGLLKDGTWIAIYAKAVILAAGGAGGLNQVASCPKQVAGNSYSLALKAGAHVKSMELNHFYSVGLPTPTGRYVHCAPVTLMMKNALLRNDAGEDIVKKHLNITLQEAVPPIGTRFDWLPRVVAIESEHGKVWLDLTKVPAKDWDNLPERNWKQIRQAQVDLRTTPVAILPLSQSHRGGVGVNTDMKTELSGLYAAGEAATGWYAEMGISALPTCLAMGAIAARTAVAELGEIKAPPSKVQDGGLKEAEALSTRKGKIEPSDIDAEIRSTIFHHFSPVKGKTSIEEGLKELELAEKKTADMNCNDARQLTDGLEVKAELLTAKAMLRSGLLRNESRGCFYRRDFPERDDKNWLRYVLSYCDPKTGEVKVEKGERPPAEK